MSSEPRSWPGALRVTLLVLCCAPLASCYLARGNDLELPYEDDLPDASPDAGAASAGAGAASDAGRGPVDTGVGAAVDAAVDGGLDGGLDGSPSATTPPDAGTGALADAAAVPDAARGPRIAFFGDQSLRPGAEAVLALVVDQQADAVVHLGDFDYLDDPEAWFAMVDGALGPGFPYLVAVGNHDVPRWDGEDGYQARLEQRLGGMAGVRCTGELGVKQRCEYRGVTVVLSGVGTLGDGHEEYLAGALAEDAPGFRLCAWHKNQHDMQVGSKPDEVGWGAYQICQEHGALVVTGHEHSYSRTYTLARVGDVDAGHGRRGPAHTIRLAPGTTGVLVSGLGGHSARDYLATSHDDDTWWASIYAGGFQRESGRVTGIAETITFGALFIDFEVDGDPSRALGQFITVDGQVVDRFDITRKP